MNFLEYVDKQIKLIEINEPLYRDFFLLKKGRRVFRALSPFSNRGSANDPHKGNVMIIFGGFRARPIFYKYLVTI